jgi:hypothetical protein
MNTRVSSTLIAVAIWLFAASPGAQGANKFKVRLSWVPIDGTTAAAIAGSGSATAELAGAKLSIAGTFEGLRSPATIAQLHRGPKTGVRGPVVSSLTVATASSGAISGSVQLTAEQIDDLRKGRLYLQIHSEGAPEGNLWGWLLQ